VLLVGGFAASDWLFSNLQAHLQIIDLHLSRPDGHLCVYLLNANLIWPDCSNVGGKLFLTELSRSCLIILSQHVWLEQLLATGLACNSMRLIPSIWIAFIPHGQHRLEVHSYRVLSAESLQKYVVFYKTIWD
jgi:hypothetical protein